MWSGVDVTHIVNQQAEASTLAASLLPGLAQAPSGPANPLRAAARRFLEERKITLET